MTLGDKMTGPSWIIWIVFAIFAILTVVFFFGKGSGLIAGYNTAGKEEQEKYDKKKLNRVMGWGMAVISIMLLVMAIGINVLPAAFLYVFVVTCIVDCVAMIVLGNTICKN